MNTARWLGYGSAVCFALSLFLPWGTVSASGATGPFTLHFSLSSVIIASSIATLAFGWFGNAEARVRKLVVTINIVNASIVLAVYFILANLARLMFQPISGNSYILPQIGFVLYVSGISLLVAANKKSAALPLFRLEYNRLSAVGWVGLFIIFSAPLLLPKTFSPRALRQAHLEYMRQYRIAMQPIKRAQTFTIQNALNNNYASSPRGSLSVSWKEVASAVGPTFVFSFGLSGLPTVSVHRRRTVVLSDMATQGIFLASANYAYNPVRVTFKILSYNPSTKRLSFQETIRALGFYPMYGRSASDNIWTAVFMNDSNITPAEMCYLNSTAAANNGAACPGVATFLFPVGNN